MDTLMKMMGHYGEYVAVLVGIASLLATVIPDTNPVGKAVHWIALNFGKAKNLSSEPVAVKAVAEDKVQKANAEVYNRG